MNKLTETLKTKAATAKYAVAGLTMAVPTVLYAFPSYAADPTDSSVMDGAVANLTGACSDMALSIGKALGEIIPLALPLVGISLVVTVGLSVFKRVTSKA